jgi:hypothetical protein
MTNYIFTIDQQMGLTTPPFSVNGMPVNTMPPSLKQGDTFNFVVNVGDNPSRKVQALLLYVRPIPGTTDLSPFGDGSQKIDLLKTSKLKIKNSGNWNFAITGVYQSSAQIDVQWPFLIDPECEVGSN